MSHNESVTVVVTRKVKRGRESEYEDWLRRLLEEAKSMKGYLMQRSRNLHLDPQNTGVFLDLILSTICANSKNQNCVPSILEPPVPARQR
jgi:hypothetical protein